MLPTSSFTSPDAQTRTGEGISEELLTELDDSSATDPDFDHSTARQPLRVLALDTPPLPDHVSASVSEDDQPQSSAIHPGQTPADNSRSSSVTIPDPYSPLRILPSPRVSTRGPPRRSSSESVPDLYASLPSDVHPAMSSVHISAHKNHHRSSSETIPDPSPPPRAVPHATTHPLPPPCLGPYTTTRPPDGRPSMRLPPPVTPYEATAREPILRWPSSPTPGRARRARAQTTDETLARLSTLGRRPRIERRGSDKENADAEDGERRVKRPKLEERVELLREEVRENTRCVKEVRKGQVLIMDAIDKGFIDVLQGQK